MRHSFLAFLLLSCLLFPKASGIRLEKESPVLRQQKQQDHQDNALGTSNENVNEAEVFGCTNGQCKGKYNRKLVTTSISSASTTPKTVKSEGHQDEPSLKNNSTDDETIGAEGNEKTSRANSSSVSKYHEIVHHENYPDLTDIAVMDYSPARRKPPIHN